MVGWLFFLDSSLFQDVAPGLLVEIVALYRDCLTSLRIPVDRVIFALALPLESVLDQIVHGHLTLVHTISPPSDGIITQNYTNVKSFE